MSHDLLSWKPQRTVRETSLEAKDVADKRAPNLRTRIWIALNREGPKTPDEVAYLIDESILSVRPQFTLLTKENKIEDTGERRTNDSGRKAIVWKALDAEHWQEEPAHLTAKERIEMLEAENNRLRSALRFYMMANDGGSRARQALQETGE